MAMTFQSSAESQMAARQRVLITGGAGFIGTALTQALLDRGHTVVLVDSLVTGKRDQVPAGARLHVLDVRDEALMDVFRDEGPFDLVLHYAALKDVRKALVDPRADAEANIIGTLNVLRCAADSGAKRFVYPSSSAIYGDPALLPTPEDAPPAPISPYGISKWAAEAYCAYFAQARGLRCVALRYGSVYGPAAAEETEAGVITIFAKRMLAGKQPVIYGDGEQTRDLVYVDDVVDATLAAARHAPAPWAVYNVGTGTESSINEVYRRLAQYAEFSAPPEYQPPKPGEVRRNVLDVRRVQRDLGWAPRVSLRDGLALVVNAYQSGSAAAASETTSSIAPSAGGR
jgi:UDP-glucose 4-epimerase